MNEKWMCGLEKVFEDFCLVSTIYKEESGRNRKQLAGPYNSK
jgi:hypothetical protein